MAWTTLASGTLASMTARKIELQFSEGIPRFFLTGDGHRNPPFKWIESCKELELHFLGLMAQGQLCVHVEEHPEAIRQSSIPLKLHPLLHSKRVFGWELDIYRVLRPVMEVSMGVVGQEKRLTDVVYLDKEWVRINALLWQIGGGSQTLRQAQSNSFKFRSYFQARSKGAKKDLLKEAAYDRFLLDWNRAAMVLRTDANAYIARNIQKVINQYPDATHLITCGDAHISINPLQQYIRLPEDAPGIIDLTK